MNNQMDGIKKRNDGSYSLYLPTQSSSSATEYEPVDDSTAPSPSILHKQFKSQFGIHSPKDAVETGSKNYFTNPHLQTPSFHPGAMPPPPPRTPLSIKKPVYNPHPLISRRSCYPILHQLIH